MLIGYIIGKVSKLTKEVKFSFGGIKVIYGFSTALVVGIPSPCMVEGPTVHP